MRAEDEESRVVMTSSRTTEHQPAASAPYRQLRAWLVVELWWCVGDAVWGVVYCLARALHSEDLRTWCSARVSQWLVLSAEGEAREGWRAASSLNPPMLLYR